MGKIIPNLENLTFTTLQRSILDEFAQTPKLKKTFYFTGGTALSGVYLHHRESEDLDFFSENIFDSELVEQFIDKIAQINHFGIRFTPKERTKIYELTKKSKVVIKIDFAYYPYKRLKKSLTVNGVAIDSLRDIATNKLHTITSRTEVKDFVDLYFLLKEFTLWDLIYGVKEKFRIEVDLIWLSSDFLKVNKFNILPKMLLPFKLKDLQDFFKEQAIILGKQVTE